MKIQLTFWLVILTQLVFASADSGNKAIEFLRSQADQLGLQQEDIKELRVSSLHKDTYSGFTHIYIQQYHVNYPIEAAIAVLLERPDGQVMFLNHNFVDRVSDMSHKQTIKSQEQIQAFIRPPSLGDIQKINVPGLIWTREQGHLILAYDFRIETKSHYWRVYLEAHSGREIKRKDLYLHCHPTTFPDQRPSICHELDREVSTFVASENYLVYPLGVESPTHGLRQEVSSPADPIASPFGWHDLDGREGAEYFDTRGNNTFTQDDPLGNDLQDRRPEGGQDLIFHFDLDFDSAPNQSVEAAVTNLFYWTNVNHDLFYHYGFDEAAGNFQVNNYERGGQAEDPVYADAQDASDRNNARFLVQEDGTPAKLQMHLWSDNVFDAKITLKSNDGDLLTIEAVESGFSNNNKLIDWDLSEAELVRVNDASGGGHLGCLNTGIGNKNGFSGKIAVVDRGQCFFVEKVKQLQDLGAIAVIVCNNVAGDPIVMGGEDQLIRIPTIMISQDQCSILVNLLNQKMLSGQIERRADVGDLDSSFDNLIITHEYGHGISIRLTGGSNIIDCLDNAEQMGEGWSDYFGLMLTTDWTSAKGDTPRGIGTFVSNQSPSGRGLRDFPYSTNQDINLMTYDQVKESPFTHAVGAIWCAMLWDMTWAIIASEGVSDDLYRGDGGNNKALRLVMEGLKLQPCYPGFVDGRDALLQADSLLYQGAHQYQIWKSFAGRGLGVNASQGNSNNTFDGVSDYHLPEFFETQIEDFRSQDVADHINISFTSIQEYDNRSFRIERGTELNNFEAIHTLAGLTISQSPRPLSHDDFDVLPGQMYYYRLVQTGIANQERIIGLDSAILLPVEDLLIFPNPARDLINLKISRSLEGKVQMALFDGSGKIVKQHEDEASSMYSRYALNYSDIPCGIYFFQLINKESSFWRKIVIRQ